MATEVLASYDNDGTLNVTTLKSNLKSRGGNVKNGEGFSVEVEMDGYTFIINGKGNILSADEIKIGNAINADKYGNEVTAKNSSTELADETWKLFYQDENYTYIIHDKLVLLESILETSYGDNYNSGKVGAIGQALNPMIKLQKPEMFTLSNSQPNMKGVAYLTDPDKWKEYSNRLDGALYAIGSPTIELFRASFNAAMSEHAIKDSEKEISAFSLGSFGYEVYNYCGQKDSGSFSGDMCNGIYVSPVGNDSCWMGSPNASDVKTLWYVNKNRGCFDGCDVDENMCVRPLVCFQTSIFNELYSYET